MIYLHTEQTTKRHDLMHTIFTHFLAHGYFSNVNYGAGIMVGFEELFTEQTTFKIYM